MWFLLDSNSLSLYEATATRCLAWLTIKTGNSYVSSVWSNKKSYVWALEVQHGAGTVIVWGWDYHSCFNRTVSQNTYPSYVRAPQSPDLNPAEMVWDDLDARVKVEQLTSAQHMWGLLQGGWKRVPADYLMKLVESVQTCYQSRRYSEESKI